MMTSGHSLVSREVQWVKDIFGNSHPAWSTEPSVLLLQSIARTHLHIPADVSCLVTPFAQGAFNKLYTIDTPESSYLIRVVSPVEPRFKTLSEIATIEFVREHVSGLVPPVLAYDADAQTPESGRLGFEWMIMGRLPGDVLKERWDGIDWYAKVALVKTLVGILSKLYDHQLSGTGNIYPDSPTRHIQALVPNLPVVGRIVSMSFFWDEHFEQDVSRGPFRSSHDWLAACLQFTLNDAVKGLALAMPENKEDQDSDAGDEREEALETQSLSESLLRLLPRVFPSPPSTDDLEEITIIHHDDLSFHNLLVDSSGILTGIVDWECVSALPLWRACTLPSFLSGRTRHDKPNVDSFSKDDDGRPNELYFEHMLEWEQTQLHAIFLEEMERIRPEWVRVYRASVLKNDFFTAVMQCDDTFSRSRVRLWTTRMEGMTDEELQEGPVEGYESLVDMIRM